MNKKIKIVLLAAFAILVVVLASAYIIAEVDLEKIQGKLVFAQSYNLGDKIDKVIIKTTEDEIELKQKNSFWYVASKGNYYADFKLLNRFFTSMNNSVYSIKLPYDENVLKEGYLLNPLDSKDDSGMLIKTYVGDDLIDEVIVGLPSENGNYFFAKRPDVREIWLIDGDFNLPIEGKDWLLYPIFSVVKDSIEKVQLGDDFVTRDIQSAYFINKDGREIDLDQLLRVMSGVRASNSLRENDFVKDKMNEKVIELTTFYGLVITCKVYSNDDNKTWLNIKLSTTALPKSAVNDYIKDNGFLYDGWYFEITPEQGSILRNFRLI